MPPGAPGQGDQCIFCQLIDNPDQLMLVGETDNFYAWLDINPRAKGHTMVVPKEHIESMMEFDPGMYHEAMTLTREVVEKAKKGLGADGTSITINIEEAGGQMMDHAYIQIWPRFQEDENAGTPTGAIFPQREDLKEELPDIEEEMNSVSVSFEQETKTPHPESMNHLDRGPDGEEEEPEEESEEIKKDRQKNNRRRGGKSIEWQ